MITDYKPLYSYMLLTGLGILVALIDAFRTRRSDGAGWLGWLTAVGAVGALALDWIAPDSRPWNGLLVFDGFARSFDAVFLVTLAVIAVASASGEGRMKFAGEYYGLLVFSTIGVMLMAASGGLLPLYIGLELSTICLFALTGFAKRERRSAEASLKMFVLGAVASAVILYGASIIYGVMAAQPTPGGTLWTDIAAGLSGATTAYAAALWLGVALVVGGIAFKIAAAPFHLWAPDVYEGAPTTVSAYLSTVSKAGGFAALMRLLLAGLGSASEQWIPVIAALAGVSMIVGNLAAIWQSNLKRLLAYSGIAQAGYILVAVSAGPRSELASGAIWTYLLLYALSNAGAFLIAQAVADATGSDKVEGLRGLHKRNPPLAFAMLVILFSLGGIPPLAGFVGKLYLFAAGWEGGQHGLVLIGAITSVAALYYYLMVALQVYIRDPADDRRLPVSRPLGLAIAACVLATLAIGVYPRPWIDLGRNANPTAISAAAPAARAVAAVPHRR